VVARRTAIVGQQTWLSIDIHGCWATTSSACPRPRWEAHLSCRVDAWPHLTHGIRPASSAGMQTNSHTTPAHAPRFVRTGAVCPIWHRFDCCAHTGIWGLSWLATECTLVAVTVGMLFCDRLLVCMCRCGRIATMYVLVCGWTKVASVGICECVEAFGLSVWVLGFRV
jgi:hypothetical protein